MTAERRLAPHLHRLPLQGLAERFGGTPAPWFDEWLAHPDLADPYWDRYRATPAVLSSTVPALLIGGWQDWMLEQTLYQYAALRDRGVDVELIIGPWAHLGLDLAATTSASLDWLRRARRHRRGPTGCGCTSPACASCAACRTGHRPAGPTAPGTWAQEAG
jgi:predicted acyl esterase